MQPDREQQIIADVKKYILDNFSLSQINDEELEEKIEDIVRQKIGSQYYPIDQIVSIVQQIFSSFRGLGLLDSILSDDGVWNRLIFLV